MITIRVMSADGALLAQTEHESEALLGVDRAYQPGDAIVIESDNKHLMVQMDATILPGEVYLPEGKMTWVVPSGEHRLAYCPVAFGGARHIVTARAMTQLEVSARRNLACNPSDLRGDTDFFPHCTANVETRGESCFAARNVIDGMRHSNYHGEWPFQSWGIGAREDAWCLLDFGREVRVDEMALTLRADFHMTPTGSADMSCCPMGRRWHMILKRREIASISRWAASIASAGCGLSACKRAMIRLRSQH